MFQKNFLPLKLFKQIDLGSYLKKFANSGSTNFKSNSRSSDQVFLTVGQNNFLTKYHFSNLPNLRYLTISCQNVVRCIAPRCSFKMLQHNSNSTKTILALTNVTVVIE